MFKKIIKNITLSLGLLLVFIASYSSVSLAQSQSPSDWMYASLIKSQKSLNNDIKNPLKEITARDVSADAVVTAALQNDYATADLLLQNVLNNQVTSATQISPINPANSSTNPSPFYSIGEIPYTYQIGNNLVYTDHNSTDFCMLSFGTAYNLYGNNLKPFEPNQNFQSTIQKLDAAIQALEAQTLTNANTNYSINVNYTNMYLTNLTDLILLGQFILTQNPNDTIAQGAVAQGKNNLIAWLAFTATNGIIEYDSSTYYGTDLFALAMGYSLTTNNPDPEINPLFKEALDTFGADIVANYFKGNESLSGPESRNYNFIVSKGAMNIWYYALGLTTNQPSTNYSGVDLINVYLSNYTLPTNLANLANTPNRVVTQLWQKTAGTTVFGQDRYNYITPDYTIGTVGLDNTSYDSNLVIQLSSTSLDMPNTTIVPDDTDSPYGITKLLTSGGETKPFHLPLLPVNVQYENKVIEMLRIQPDSKHTGIITQSTLSSVPVTSGLSSTNLIWTALINSGYINSSGVIQNSFYTLTALSQFVLTGASSDQDSKVYSILQQSEAATSLATNILIPLKANLYKNGVLLNASSLTPGFSVPINYNDVLTVASPTSQGQFSVKVFDAQSCDGNQDVTMYFKVDSQGYLNNDGSVVTSNPTTPVGRLAIYHFGDPNITTSPSGTPSTCRCRVGIAFEALSSPNPTASMTDLNLAQISETYSSGNWGVTALWPANGSNPSLTLYGWRNINNSAKTPLREINGLNQDSILQNGAGLYSALTVVDANTNNTIFQLPGIPNPPTTVNATAGVSQATVNFSGASPNLSPITSYTVTSFPGGITATGTSSPITVYNLTNEIPYEFNITATNAIGTSAPSPASNYVTPSQNSYTITATAGNFGSISPSGTTTVNYDGSQTYNLIPDQNYTIDTITVNGTALPNKPSSYTFSNVRSNQTINVTFTPLLHNTTINHRVIGKPVLHRLIL